MLHQEIRQLVFFRLKHRGFDHINDVFSGYFHTPKQFYPLNYVHGMVDPNKPAFRVSLSKFNDLTSNYVNETSQSVRRPNLAHFCLPQGVVDLLTKSQKQYAFEPVATTSDLVKTEGLFTYVDTPLYNKLVEFIKDNRTNPKAEQAVRVARKLKWILNGKKSTSSAGGKSKKGVQVVHSTFIQ